MEFNELTLHYGDKFAKSPANYVHPDLMLK